MPEKAPIYKLSRSKAPKNTADLPLQTYEKNQWTFILYDTAVDFSSRNNSANLDSFAKVSIPVGSISPRIYVHALIKKLCPPVSLRLHTEMSRLSTRILQMTVMYITLCKCIRNITKEAQDYS